SIHETITPEAVHSVRTEVETSSVIGCSFDPWKYASAAELVPLGRMCPTAYESCWRNASVRCAEARIAASTSSAGNSVRIDEYAAALAMPKASSSSERQSARLIRLSSFSIL